MDISRFIKRRLEQLDLDQRDLAAAAQVTESYISQLLNGKKNPPLANRTEIYQKMEVFLDLSSGQLSHMADIRHNEELKKRLGDRPTPLFEKVRELTLGKCVSEREPQIRAIFEKHPFNELEQLVTQKILDVVKRVVRKEMESKDWIRKIARTNNQDYERARAEIIEFLDTDIFHISADILVTFLEPLIESWDIDLETFGMEIILNKNLFSEHIKKLEFVEKEAEPPFEEEPGLKEFLNNPVFKSEASEDEIAFLRKLRFIKRRPTALYYYRELQNLRDPLNFSQL